MLYRTRVTVVLVHFFDAPFTHRCIPGMETLVIVVREAGKSITVLLEEDVEHKIVKRLSQMRP